jgi:hypothetical protein
LGAGLGATKEGRMALILLQVTPDGALMFLSLSAVNRRVAVVPSSDILHNHDRCSPAFHSLREDVEEVVVPTSLWKAGSRMPL